MLRDSLQELRELGFRGTAFRIGWELKTRTGLTQTSPLSPRAGGSRRTRVAHVADDWEWTARLPFADPVAVADAMRDRISAAALQRLDELATQAIRGRILCFGHWMGNYGTPPDWTLNPVNGRHWDPKVHWSRALAAEAEVGDVKLSWELGRFPQAYHLARAAAFRPGRAEELAHALYGQVLSFVRENPIGFGIHWASGQEVAIRLLAWLFALDTLMVRSGVGREAASTVRAAFVDGCRHIERFIDYARVAVYNNHLLSEALGLHAAGALLPDPEAHGWRELSRSLLDEAAERQFYGDGAYIQQSHNYHRVAIYSLLWAATISRTLGEEPSDQRTSALARSLDFLLQQQNPTDGRLPNYGSNDGALPSVLSTCDFSDFRPCLQAVSLAVRGERLYPPGPWDEAAAWLLGPQSLEAPMRAPERRSLYFNETGYVVLRGQDETSFATFRCGTIRDRFAQIDMLHLDVWWRGHNVLVDPGSYLYNGPAEWHDHFMRTASHNTLTVDGHDQMLHYRRFKALYWTRANVLHFEDGERFSLCVGEHLGFSRLVEGCVHRRSVLMVKDGLWVVVDRVEGQGPHTVRLHWLAGDFPFRFDRDAARLQLETPAGPFSVAIRHADGSVVPADLVAGRNDPPRGWLSRYYAHKIPVPSLATELSTTLPQTLVTVLGPGAPELARDARGGYVVRTETQSVTFQLLGGRIAGVRLAPESTSGARV